MGAGIECDVRLSADGKVMVVHDHDLQRLCGSDDAVEATSAEALADKQLVGTDERIPRLSDLLDLVAGRAPVLIEVKTCEGNANQLTQAVEANLADYEGPAGVMSFDPQVSRWLRTNAPHIRRGLVIRDDLPTARRWLAMLVAAPQFIAVDRAALGKSWVASVRRRMPFYSWTIRSPEQRVQAEVHADALIWEGDGRPRN
jgi:glycerophosphoryl diester phosphodiesterase